MKLNLYEISVALKVEAEIAEELCNGALAFEIEDVIELAKYYGVAQEEVRKWLGFK